MTAVIAMPATSPASKPADSAFVPLTSIVDLINAAAERNQIAKVDGALDPPHQPMFRSNAIRNNAAIIRAPATNVPRKVPETFDSPPVRQR